jgi:hypothetical protein
MRRHDVMPPSFSATVFTMPRPHGLTIVELFVVYTRYPAGSADRYIPAAVIKWNPLPGTADAKVPFPSELGIITVLVPSPASLGHLGTSHLFHLFRSSLSKLFFRIRCQHRGEAQSRPEEELKPSCHP